MSINNINDNDIIEFLKEKEVLSEAYNYYIYGSKEPIFKWFALIDFFWPFGGKSIIANFADYGILIVHNKLNGKTDIKFIDAKDITKIRVKNSNFYLGYKIKINYKEGKKFGTVVLSATKYVMPVKKQGENLKGIKELAEKYKNKKIK